MIEGQIRNILRGIGGEFEINRVVGAMGSIAYIVCAHVFVAYEVLWKDREFDLTAYCLAFPSGLGVAVASIAGAVAIKDRNVASAKVIHETGSKPATPPAPAPVAQPELVADDDASGLPEAIR